MLRPVIACATLALAAFLLAPTVGSVQEGVHRLEIRRDMPWALWKWPEAPAPAPQAGCALVLRETHGEVDEWPRRLDKASTLSVGGIVTLPGEGGRGAPGLEVEIHLNHTKALPGERLGVATTGPDGRFRIETRVPQDLEARRYHLVAHVLARSVGCERYLEHWSDPELDLTSESRILLEAPRHALVGHETRVGGRLLDGVGAPVRGAAVTVRLESELHLLVTGQDGRFDLPFVPGRVGEASYEVAFHGTDHYGEASARTRILVGDGNVHVEGSDGPDGLRLVRNRTQPLSGHVLLPDQAAPREVRLVFEGVEPSACEGCPASPVLVARPDEKGRFSLEAHVPGDQPVGPFRLRLEAEGLPAPGEFEGLVVAPVTLRLDAADEGSFARRLGGSVRLLDEAGRPLEAPVAVLVGDRWLAGSTGADGRFPFVVEAPCGDHPVQAYYNATPRRDHAPAMARAEASACPALAFLSAGFLGLPRWGWLLAFLALPLPAVAMVHRLMSRHAAAPLHRGPPLHARIVQPDDAAGALVAPGEPVDIEIRLPSPLPRDHRILAGAPRAMREVPVTGPVCLGTLVPAGEGFVPLRVEVLDARGRVVARRILPLKVAPYAREIEERYLGLQRTRLGPSAGRMSPRDFEAWLRGRGLDAGTVRRLVGIFEEADYGPRAATRDDLLAYVRAEAGLQEVKAPAMA